MSVFCRLHFLLLQTDKETILGQLFKVFTKVTTCFTEKLQELKEQEKEAEYFTKMPSKHYMEVASLLLNR